jgi:hypothetical protein
MTAEQFHLTIRRLRRLLPGWHVWWVARQGPGEWCAVPAAPGTTLDVVVTLPDRICAREPAELVALCIVDPRHAVLSLDSESDDN